MRGLLKNNIYATLLSGKIFAAFICFAGIIIVGVISQSLLAAYGLIAYGLMGPVGFSVCALIAVKKEFSSKWGKYKLTLPVKRTDIIKSQFWNQLIWLFVGVVFAGIGIGLSWLFHGCLFDQPLDILMLFTLGISVSLLMGALYFPAFYLFGEERGEIILLIALLCAFGLDCMLVGIINNLLAPGTAAMIIGAAILLLCSLSAFSASCPLTIWVYNRKEY
ncbi:MAG: ABC-2 transporter permease [Lachnospiraceae bacterium]|nr:ABC-2 transporter permease [Lachnospiraceae bacterium]